MKETIKAPIHKKHLTFLPFHQPPLESGEYRMTAHQEIENRPVFKEEKIPIGSELVEISIPTVQYDQFHTAQSFYVAGERFHILPDQVKEVFPPVMGVANFSNVFPHLILTPSTLPWQRTAEFGQVDAPWLMLLLLHESEKHQAKVSNITLEEWSGGSNQSPWFPPSALEPGQSTKEKVQVIDLPLDLGQQLIPDLDSLKFCAHVRRTTEKNQDRAVLVAPRLPEKGAVNSVHLISLENRFKDGVLACESAKPGDDIRFVHLHSWTFTSTEHFKVSKALLSRTDQFPPKILDQLNSLLGKQYYTKASFEEALRKEAGLNNQEWQQYQKLILHSCSFGDFAGTLKHLDRTPENLHLAEVGDTALDPYLRLGYCPLPHQLRTGTDTFSWYHGPLATGRGQLPCPEVTNSDALLQYYAEGAMIDVSYAAAWELGHWLTLANQPIATALFQDKMGIQQLTNGQHQAQIHHTSHLHASGQPLQEPAPQTSVNDWLRDLKRLKGIPFSYLVPEATMLPPESIRFFTLSSSWVNALLQGAISIGGKEAHALYQNDLPNESFNVSGFLLRSEVVPGWPGMSIEGYGNTIAQNKLSIIRREALSGNVLIVLFDGILEQLDFHLKPEVLHFGVDRHEFTDSVPSPLDYYAKSLRNKEGEELMDQRVEVPFTTQGVMKIPQTLKLISDRFTDAPNIDWNEKPDAALFALQMIEGVEKVRFTLS